MTGAIRSHYLKGEPEFELWPGSPKFSCFYDYDQLRDKKLTRLTDTQKVLWFTKRIEMTFLSPLHAIFRNPPASVFNELMDASLSPPRSFFIGLMSVMMNGVEALGSFLRPEFGSGNGDNKKMFEAFLEEYLSTWWRHPVPNGTSNITNLFWKCFRNGVVHGFQITPPGSLEFLEDKPYRWDDG
jgi:hypothetical protein